MIELHIEKMLPVVLSLQNTNRYVIEGWIFGDARLANLSIKVGGKSFPARYTEIMRRDVARLYSNRNKQWSLFSGFAIPVFLDPVDVAQELQVTLLATFRNQEILEKQLGTLTLKPWQKDQPRITLPPDVDPDKLVFIAMATYNPDQAGLLRQIESIRDQDYQHWICLVCDDASEPEKLQVIRNVLSGDCRFMLLENEQNVGAYRNFERCLEQVPPEARYVAMADQDDYWYPGKLSRTIVELTGPTQLAYCDMRIVGHDGAVISETFWCNRKNYYLKKDLDLLTLANTVGATAAVFRVELLQKVLPFPEFGGNLHHDKWLAIIAAASGGIEYVNAPLYDYIQHADNVIGFCDFNRTSIMSGLKSWHTYHAYRTARRSIPFHRRMKPYLRMILDVANEMTQFYYIHGKQVETFAEAAACRGLDAESLGLISRVSSSPGLFRMLIKIRLTKATSNNLEVRLLAGRFVNAIMKIFLPTGCRLVWRRFCRNNK
ncbi:MAG: glycosyltransferase [Desulfuromonadales bacterium]|nr:glycosyltransferase [Desulfuromonadales bacterium]